MFTPELESYLNEIKVPLRLSCITESGWPIVLSLWFVYKGRKLFCATKESAKVVNYLKNEPRCSFEIAADSLPYCGVRGTAYAKINKTRGVEILRILLNRYLGGENSSLAKSLLKEGRKEVAIELQPVKIFSWNFDKRMKNAVSEKRILPCP